MAVKARHIAAAALLCAAVFAGGVALVRGIASHVIDDGYAGSESCRECHEREYGLWLTGPHTRQFRAATNEVKGAVWAIGINDVVQYFRPLGGGRLQTMPWSWDLKRREWYNTTGSMVRDWIPGDGPVHWTHESLTFNSSCMGCHVAPAWRGYDAKSRTYSSHWMEPRISCEGCHGPLKRHVKLPLLFGAKKLGDESCIACHVKLYGDAIESQSQDLPELVRRERAAMDPANIVMLEDIDFTADGRDLGENYTITRWMMRVGVGKEGTPGCLTCHTSSGRTRAKGDANCTACHADKSVEVHGRHAKGGARRPTCVDCHMPSTSFARITHVDHSLRPPDPGLAVMHGGSSACAKCHSRGEEENSKIVEGWFPDSSRREKVRREARLVMRARIRDPEVEPEAREYIDSPDANPVVAESLRRLLSL